MVKSEATKFVRLRSFFSTSSKNSERLLDHRHLEDVVVLGIERAVGHRGVDGAEAQPLAGEVLGEGRRLGIAQHALDLLAEHVRLAQLALLRRA